MQQSTLTASTPPKLLLIYTGGTIGMIEDPDSGALKAFDFVYLQEKVPELRHLGCHTDVIQYTPPLDSSAIDTSLWIQLEKTIREQYHRYDGFVVLHGTDTMAYSASALSFLLGKIDKPVVFTGSQLPIGKLRTDGKENLITAIEVAIAKDSEGKALVPEVAVFFGDHLLRGNRATKASADQFSAFVSYNYPPLAYAGIDITYLEKNIGYKDCTTFEAEYPALDPNVLVLKLFPGITASVIENMLSAPDLKGVVLETYGSGNAPSQPWFLQLLQRTIEKEIPIVNVTQCASGKVDMLRYETGQTLSQIGVVSGTDMTTECAVTKMMYLLGQKLPYQRLCELLATPLRGEMAQN